MAFALYLFAVSILTAANAGIADRRFKKGDIAQGSFAAFLVVLGIALICKEVL